MSYRGEGRKMKNPYTSMYTRDIIQSILSIWNKFKLKNWNPLKITQIWVSNHQI